ncbi:DNA mismatch endonuclease Vsr [Actinotalea ferrariae]|uniref:DNA mismatch endonuclease Vsr n=1 Tax=Actinotalea ferrariae TaxID=1386098 RepID=UPI0035AB9370
MSLFAGVGGLDLGLERAGLATVEMAESWEPARRVLRDRFSAVALAGDVSTYTPRSRFEVLAAGFPCTDLSHAGRKTGIFGASSGLVSHAFRIAAEARPNWIVLENVPNLLALHRGVGMRYIIEELESLGYRWAYRTVDSRATGVPQRRPRVIILASLTHHPEATLLVGSATAPNASMGESYGFYWTEGRSGLGLVDGAVPTLKGGSTLGLPSAPAVWFPAGPRGRRFVLPRLEDGEALQGLPRGWTRAAVVPDEPDLRWKLVGNAVTVGVGHWVGRCIVAAEGTRELTERARPGLRPVPPLPELNRQSRWPAAGFGSDGSAWASDTSMWPMLIPGLTLGEVVDIDRATPLSHRATNGFLSRLDESGMKVPTAFYRDLEDHQQRTRPPLTRKYPDPWPSSDAARRRMKTQRSRDTKPEVALRRELRRLGLGYRLQVRPLPNLRARLDIVFIGAKVAVDVRGCFWHSCREHGTRPRANAERWADKLARNVERDRTTEGALTSAGWMVIVIWEHDDPVVSAARIALEVRSRRASLGRTARSSDPAPLGAVSEADARLGLP